MEKKIIYSPKAKIELQSIYQYLINNWGIEVLENFEKALKEKEILIITHPKKGYTSSRYSKFRKTLVTNHYILIYRYTKNVITIHRIKHSSQNK